MWRGATYCARAAALDLLRRFTLNPIRTSRPEPRQGSAAPCISAQKATPSVLPPEKPEPLGLMAGAVPFSFHRFFAKSFSGRFCKKKKPVIDRSSQKGEQPFIGFAFAGDQGRCLGL